MTRTGFRSQLALAVASPTHLRYVPPPRPWGVRSTRGIQEVGRSDVRRGGAFRSRPSGQPAYAVCVRAVAEFARRTRERGVAAIQGRGSHK